MVHLLTLKYEELSYPKNQEMCDLILVTLLKMRPHDSQSSRKNATPSSCTTLLASYKKPIPPPPPTGPSILQSQGTSHPL